MKKLRYITVQPRLLYYAWQVEVMINNYIKHGINGEDVDILVAWNPIDGTSTEEAISAWEKLAAGYSTFNFHFYQDTRVQPIHYISSIRPNLLKQHFTKYPELKDYAIYYSDCDAVFTKKPDFDKFLSDDVWYLSDTNSYINSTYILSKGQDVYDKMCEIVGIDPNIPADNDEHSGGAQYIMKNVDADYWAKVEMDCERMFFEINQLNYHKKAADPQYHELQIWCADMWAVLWNGWLKGHDIKVVPELTFSWATDPVHRWDETMIYHNAGVTCNCGRQFFKGQYMNEYPYGIQEESFTKTTSAFNYVKEIIETSSKSCLITR